MLRPHGQVAAIRCLLRQAASRVVSSRRHMDTASATESSKLANASM